MKILISSPFGHHLHKDLLSICHCFRGMALVINIVLSSKIKTLGILSSVTCVVLYLICKLRKAAYYVYLKATIPN